VAPDKCETARLDLVFDQGSDLFCAQAVELRDLSRLAQRRSGSNFWLGPDPGRDLIGRPLVRRLGARQTGSGQFVIDWCGQNSSRPEFAPP
jgi:hypothetical protein